MHLYVMRNARGYVMLRRYQVRVHRFATQNKIAEANVFITSERTEK